MKPEATSVEFFDIEHPLRVAAQIVSTELGSCGNVELVFVGVSLNSGIGSRIWPMTIDALAKIHEDVQKSNRRAKFYVNMSLAIRRSLYSPATSLKKSFKTAADNLTSLDGLVFVAAGDIGTPIDKVPSATGGNKQESSCRRRYEYEYRWFWQPRWIFKHCGICSNLWGEQKPRLLRYWMVNLA